MSDVDGLINAANVHETRIFLLFDDFEILYALSAVKYVCPERERERVNVCVCVCAWAPVNVNLTSNLPWLPSLPNCFNPLKRAEAEKGRHREEVEVEVQP